MQPGIGKPSLPLLILPPLLQPLSLRPVPAAWPLNWPGKCGLGEPRCHYRPFVADGLSLLMSFVDCVGRSRKTDFKCVFGSHRSVYSLFHIINAIDIGIHCELVDCVLRSCLANTPPLANLQSQGQPAVALFYWVTFVIGAAMIIITLFIGVVATRLVSQLVR